MPDRRHPCAAGDDLRPRASRLPAADIPLRGAAPGPGQVAVDIAACGVCRTDLHVVDGDLTGPKLPLVPGHEIVGRVRALGPGVTGLAPGDRVGVP